jgi:hypothetical protein
MTDHDHIKKKKARERRQRQKQQRRKSWQGSRSGDFAVLRKVIEVERGLAALREMLGAPSNDPAMMFLSRPCKVHKDTLGKQTLVPIGKGRVYRNPEKASIRKALNAKKRPKGMSIADWKYEQRQARITRYLATCGLEGVST